MRQQLPLLSCAGISLWRGDAPIIDDLTFSVSTGEVMRLEGENGSGKTTLLRILAGLVDVEEGVVSFRGEALPGARRKLADALLYIGHRPGVGEALTAAENLSVASAVAGQSNDAKKTDQVLAALGLGDRRQVPVAALSAGQRRRVALARLALEDRELWLLDEPLTALDVNGLAWVQQRIVEHAQSGGTVVFTTHQALEIPGVSVRSLSLSSPDAAADAHS